MQNETTQPEQKPDEAGSLEVGEYLRISDPESGEVIVNKRDS